MLLLACIWCEVYPDLSSKNIIFDRLVNWAKARSIHTNPTLSIPSWKLFTPFTWIYADQWKCEEYKWEVICTSCCRRILSVYMDKVFENQGRDSRSYHKTHQTTASKTHKTVRIIRTNNGTEFINKQLVLFFQGTDVPMGGSNCYSLLHPKPTLDTYSSQQNSIWADTWQETGSLLSIYVWCFMLPYKMTVKIWECYKLKLVLDSSLVML